jgi:hypothetical protein
MVTSQYAAADHHAAQHRGNDIGQEELDVRDRWQKHENDAARHF